MNKDDKFRSVQVIKYTCGAGTPEEAETNCTYFIRGECTSSFCEYRRKKRTNADRIRAMSDEELAKFIDDIAQSVSDGEYCTAFLNVKNFPYSCEDTKKACVAHVVDWLQQPAE